MIRSSFIRPARVFHALLACLAILHAWLAVSVSDRIGVTADEIAHITAGHAYWTRQDFRLQPENGLLPQRLAALPHLMIDKPAHPLDAPDPGILQQWKNAAVWRLGATYFYESGNDVPRLLRHSRWMIAVLGGIAVFLIGDWSGRLAGRAAGLASAGLAATSPTLLAHAGLATSDTAGMLGFLLATAAGWRLCHRLTLGRIAAAGVGAGLLALCKHSAVLFAPIAVVLVVARLTCAAPLPVRLPGLRANRLRGVSRLGALVGGQMAAAFIAWAVVWGGYGFRYDARGPDTPESAEFVFPWSEVMIPDALPYKQTMADDLDAEPAVEIKSGPVQSVVRVAREHHLLPEAWLYGLAFVDRHSRYRPSFLAGEWNPTGSVTFFPLAFLMKSTPSELAFALLLGALLPLLAIDKGAAGRRTLYRTAPLLAVIAVYGAASLASNLNIGHRHILPIYGCGFVLTGLVFARARHRLPGKIAAMAASLVLIAQACSAFSARPHHLAYFNFLVGGTEQAHRFLVDSSLDWGQGLPALKEWLDTNAPGEKIHLSYFGSDRPSRLGIKCVRIGDTFFRTGERSYLSVEPLRPGVYVISATMWQRVYTLVRGPWRGSYDTAYQTHRGFWLSSPPAEWKGATRFSMPEAERYKLLENFEHLRFGRLCHHLKDRKPDAIVAGQYLVFRLTQQDLDSAL